MEPGESIPRPKDSTLTNSLKMFVHPGASAEVSNEHVNRITCIQQNICLNYKDTSSVGQTKFDALFEEILGASATIPTVDVSRAVGSETMGDSSRQESQRTST